MRQECPDHRAAARAAQQAPAPNGPEPLAQARHISYIRPTATMEIAMAAKKNAAAHDLRTPKYRPRIVKNLKKTYLRRPKHPARAADAFSRHFRTPIRSIINVFYKFIFCSYK
jgi:hypothetical protein